MIDTKRLGPALVQELQRRSVQKNADKETLLESLGDGSGAHVFVGEKTGEVSLLVPLEDGFDGPKQVNVTISGQETVVLDSARKAGVVEVEGVRFARFVLEPLRYAAQLDALGVDRPQVALRGEGPDGLWSPLGFDDWFLADYQTLRWLATSDEVVVAPEVKTDARDPSWKALNSGERDALETLLKHPVAAVVHESTLHEALKLAVDKDGVIDGALKSLSLSINTPKKPQKPKPGDAGLQSALGSLNSKAEVEALRLTLLAEQGQAKQTATELKNLASTNTSLVAGELTFGRVDQSAELIAARRQLQVVDLTPAAWATLGKGKADKASPSDACLDSVLWLAALRDSGTAKTEGALEKNLDHNAQREPVSAADAKLGVTGSWSFGDGSKVQLAVDHEGATRCCLRADDGRKVDVNLDKGGLFSLPTTMDPGPTSAMLDASLLQGANAKAELLKLGFVAVSDRYFLHKDGSWAAMVPAQGQPGGQRVAAGVGDRRYDLSAPATSRANAFGALPAWLQGMVRLSPPAQNVDLQLMARQLSALDPAMLQRMAQVGYSFDVTRYKLSNAQGDLQNLSTLDANTKQLTLVDNAGGVHRGDLNNPSIVVRTYFKDGELLLDMSTFLGTIGHAFDSVIPDAAPAATGARGFVQNASRRSDPLNVEKDYVDAYTKEHTRLPAFFHQQDRFVAETFALYMLDKTRCQRQFPLAFAAHDKRFAAMKPDAEKLADLERGFDKEAIAAPVGQDLRQVLALTAQQNKLFRDAGMPARPLVVHLEGKADWGSAGYVSDAARHLRNSFGKDAGVYRPDESFVPVTPTSFNNPAEVEKLLTEIETSGRPAVLFIEDAGQLSTTSPGWQVISDFLARGRDVPPLVIGGEPGALQNISGALPGVLRTNVKIEPLTSSLQAEAIRRLAAQDGLLLGAGVIEAVTKKLKGGGLDAAAVLWRALKAAQANRLFDEAQQPKSTPATLSTLREISKDDVDRMKVTTTKTPQERLAAMVGQKEAKRQIDAIMKQAKIAALRAQQGLPEASPLRLNLVFSGAPGTGKTTYAEILGALLQETGYIKNPSVTKITIQDILSGSPEAAIKALFEANRGGVIFLDEMHQLKDTAEGKRAFRAMTPYLTDPLYADTVFIGAGYADEMGELLRDVDPGAERRFTAVPFLDYSRDELASILDGKAKDQHLTLDKPAREAALAFLDHRKRTTKNFGNAGEIDVALAHARKAQTMRLTAMPAAQVTKAALMELKPSDFALPTPITKEAFWKEMDAMSGWGDIKAELKQMAASIEGAVKRGKAPTDAVEPYWIVDGPPGTGKSTLARMLAKFGAAYGLTAVPEVIDLQGANFQGEYVGQTAGVVQKHFERAWGRLMFVDEISGLAKSGGDFKFEAAKIILAQTENNRGKFMMVVADYSENINQFLKLDPGLARRFGKRITLAPWTAAEAGADLQKKLLDEGIDAKVVAAAAGVVEKRFAELARIPGYASGGDVRTVKGAIIALLDASGADASTGLTKAIGDAFDALIEKKQKDAGTKPKTARGGR